MTRWHQCVTGVGVTLGVEGLLSRRLGVGVIAESPLVNPRLGATHHHSAKHQLSDWSGTAKSERPSTMFISTKHVYKQPLCSSRMALCSNDIVFSYLIFLVFSTHISPIVQYKSPTTTCHHSHCLINSSSTTCLKV